MNTHLNVNILKPLYLLRSGVSVVLAMSFILAADVLSAQEGGEFSDCAQLLNSPPLDDLLTGNESKDSHELRSDLLGAALLGVKCSRAQIIEYFLSAGWELRGESHRQPHGEAGGADNRYKIDYSIAFLKYRKFPQSLIYGRREAIAGFSMFEGRVTHITSGPFK